MDIDPPPVRADEPERHDREPLRHARLGQRPVQLAPRPRHRRGHRRPLDHRHEVQPPAGPATRTARSSPSAACAGTGPAQFNWPRAIAIRQSDRTAWVADTQNDRVRRVERRHQGRRHRPVRDRQPAATGRACSTGRWGSPWTRRPDTSSSPTPSTTASSSSSADPGGTNIQFVRTISAGFNEPEAIEVSADGTIYVADTGDSEIVMLDANGTVIGTFGAAEGLDHPAGHRHDPGRQGLRVRLVQRPGADLLRDRACAPPPVRHADAERHRDARRRTTRCSTRRRSLFTGNATDDLSVTNVRVAIRNAATQQWWNGTGVAGRRSSSSRRRSRLPDTPSHRRGRTPGRRRAPARTRSR